MEHYNILKEIHENKTLRALRFKVKIIRIHAFEVFGLGPLWSYILADTDGSKTKLIISPAEASRFKVLEKGEGKLVEIFCVEIQDVFTGFRPIDFPFRLTVIDNTRIFPIPPQNNHHYMQFKPIHVIKHTTNLNILIHTMGVVFNVEPLKIYSDPKMSSIVFHIRDNIDNQLRCLATGKAAYAFNDEWEHTKVQGVVIAVLKMWRIQKYDREDAEPWIQTHKELSDFRLNSEMTKVEYFRRELANSDPYVTKYGPTVPMKHSTFNMLCYYLSFILKLD